MTLARPANRHPGGYGYTGTPPYASGRAKDGYPLVNDGRYYDRSGTR
jgi:hypothetical protein